MQQLALPFDRPPYRNAAWTRQIFDTRAAQTGGIVRRSVRSVEQEIGRDRLIAECRGRGFHLVECGGQFVIICNPGQVSVIC